jgi:hypothetical protein
MSGCGCRRHARGKMDELVGVLDKRRYLPNGESAFTHCSKFLNSEAPIFQGYRQGVGTTNMYSFIIHFYSVTFHRDCTIAVPS